MLVAKDLLSICCCPSDCSTGEAGLSQRHVESPAAAPRELCLEEPEEAVHDGVGVDAGNQDGLLGPHAQNGVGVAALCRCPEPDPHVDHGILCLVSQSVTILHAVREYTRLLHIISSFATVGSTCNNTT